jgi:hypothetical protein
MSGLTFASEGDIVKLQGVIMSIEVKQNRMVVNEGLFTWNEKTMISNAKGSPITIDKFKPKAWVYIEGVNDKKNKRIVIEKIYLLPKYVAKKEKQSYPFIQ